MRAFLLFVDIFFAYMHSSHMWNIDHVFVMDIYLHRVVCVQTHNKAKNILQRKNKKIVC